MKQLPYLIAGAAVASSALAFADAPSRPMNKKADVQAEAQRPADDKYGINLRQGFFLTADFLYWIAHEEGLEYATTGVAGASNTLTQTNVASGSAKNMNFKWKPGFRLGFGWTLPDSYWDISTNWTWYRATARGSSSHSSDVDVRMNPLFSSLEAAFVVSNLGTSVTGLTSASLDSASAKWRLHYNTLDFELGRSFYPNKYLSLRPHAGVRGAWINQRYLNLYHYDDVLNTADVKRFLKNNYHAAGFKGGIDSIWSFNRYFGIFANASMSLLGGNFHVNETDVVLDATNSVFATLDTFINLKDRFFSVVPVLEAAMGLHLTLAPDQKHYWFDLNAGWEYLVWFNQNEMNLFTDSNNRGVFIRERANLHLMGFTLNGKLHF